MVKPSKSTGGCCEKRDPFWCQEETTKFTRPAWIFSDGFRSITMKKVSSTCGKGEGKVMENVGWCQSSVQNLLHVSKCVIQVFGIWWQFFPSILLRMNVPAKHNQNRSQQKPREKSGKDMNSWMWFRERRMWMLYGTDPCVKLGRQWCESYLEHI